MKIFLFCSVLALETVWINANICGISSYKNSGNRIVGGREAVNGEFPWQISLQRKSFNADGYHHFCGATILNEHWILTAAHCLDGLTPETIRVVAGAHDIHIWSDGMTIHNAQKFIINKSFSKSTMLGDIALIRVKEAFDFETPTLFSKPVCLPKADIDIKGLAIASGWGQIAELGPDSSVLLSVELPIVTQEYCRQKFGSNLIKDTVFCAGSLPGLDTCLGDSGGPMTQTINGRTVIIGIISYGHVCGKAGWPGVYTEVSKYLDWIYDNMN